jgi:predicted nucleic acid-binding protein
MAMRYAIDTNVLLRLSHRNHPQHSLIATAMRALVGRDVEICFTPQNLGEFWNASTRPPERNGLVCQFRKPKRLFSPLSV